jgi:stearoyl-CoA desaturase (delta-9 desaturase)
MSEPAAPRSKIIWGNAIFLTLTPLLSIILVPIYFWQVGFSWAPIIAMLLLWMMTGLCITAGYHRLFSHRTYKASAPVRLVFAVLGGAAWQNSVIEWCSDHRLHHRLVDTDGDPYNAQRGFWWSHIGWIMVNKQANDFSNVGDLLRDPICKWQHDHYYKITILFNLGVPILLGLLFGDVWGMLLFAGLVRVVLVHHFTFSINSFAHIFGSQSWSKDNSSRDSWTLSLFTFGEGYHNYHHAFETDYRNGPRWYNFDPSKWLVWCLSRVGLTRDMRRTPTDVILRRRFEEHREDMAEVLHSLAEWIETWREEVAQRASEHAQAARLSLAGHLLRAEQRLDTALADMRAARNAYAAARRSEAPVDVQRSLKTAALNARRTMKAAFKDWEGVLTDWSELAIPTPA